MTAAAGDPARGLIRPSAAPPRRHDAAALLALALLTAVLFGRAVAGRGVFFQRDVQTYWRPQVDSLMRILAQGAPPVWNPYFEVGLPLLADPGYQVYYPPQWVNLLVLPDRFYALFVAGHGLFTAVGAYALGCRWSRTTRTCRARPGFPGCFWRWSVRSTCARRVRRPWWGRRRRCSSWPDPATWR